MGQKVHPGGLRVGVIHDWKSNWNTNKDEFASYLLEDIRIREHIYRKLSHAGLSDVLIRKDKQRITIDIYTARPGIVIGKSGVEVDALRREIHAMTHKNVHININEIKRPELDAKLVAQSIAEQLENRVSFRRAMKRTETYSEGRVPLHTIRADIDFGFVEAKTTFGRIGVKVWINKGELMPEGYEGIGQKETRLGEQDQARRRRGSAEGLGSGRDGGRDRRADREGLGPLRQRRRPRGPPGQHDHAEDDARGAAEARQVGRRVCRGHGRQGLVLLPRKTKFRKVQRGHRRGLSKGQTAVQFGDFGLKALEAGWITNRQVEAARIAMTRKIKRGGKVWINVFPDKAVTAKPAETRMGSGKGSPEHWVAVIKPGRVMFELAGVPEPLAKEALRLAGYKLPVKTKFVLREGAQA